jgi:hypothetical protein
MFHKKNTTLLAIALLAIVPQLTICSEASTRERTPSPERGRPLKKHVHSQKSGSPFEVETEKQVINQNTTTPSSTTKDQNHTEPQPNPIKKQTTPPVTKKTIAQQIADLEEKTKLNEAELRDIKAEDDLNANKYGKTYKGRLINGICNIPTDAHKAFWNGAEKAIGDIISKPTIAIFDRLAGNWLLNDQENNNLLASKIALLEHELNVISSLRETFLHEKALEKQFLKTENEKTLFEETIKEGLKKLRESREATQRRFEALQTNA